MITRRTFVAQSRRHRRRHRRGPAAGHAATSLPRLRSPSTRAAPAAAARSGSTTSGTSGFAPAVHDEEDMDAIKDEMGVPKGGPLVPHRTWWTSISSRDTSRRSTSAACSPSGPR